MYFFRFAGVTSGYAKVPVGLGMMLGLRIGWMSSFIGYGDMATASFDDLTSGLGKIAFMESASKTASDRTFCGT